VASKPEIVNPNGERLTLHDKPTARLGLIETQPPLTEDGITVERYKTGHGVIFEKHTTAAGVVTWYKVECF